ncbi:MAG: DUF177 domain-containing protein [Rhodocyclaceae bacterium]|nr:DUF177 domain-containing protein [Rhodocyclaceae bacterium]
MTSLAAVIIDAFEFARTGRVLDGTISLVEFPRLLDMLQEFEGELHVRIEGQTDEERKSWLLVAGSGVVVLKCQRCLERLGFPVVIHSRLQLRVGDVTEIAWSDEALDDDAYDIIPASQPLAVKDLVEDEVILLLPVSPMHDVCVLPKSGANDQKPSPFAVLAKLKKH